MKPENHVWKHFKSQNFQTNVENTKQSVEQAQVIEVQDKELVTQLAVQETAQQVEKPNKVSKTKKKPNKSKSKV